MEEEYHNKSTQIEHSGKDNYWINQRNSSFWFMQETVESEGYNGKIYREIYEIIWINKRKIGRDYSNHYLVTGGYRTKRRLPWSTK